MYYIYILILCTLFHRRRFHKIRNQADSRKFLMHLEGAKQGLKKTDYLARAKEREKQSMDIIYSDYNSGVGIYYIDNYT